MYNRDFISVEYAFASLEKEGYKYQDNAPHADAFRLGDTELIGKIIKEAANILEKRTRGNPLGKEIEKSE